MVTSHKTNTAQKSGIAAGPRIFRKENFGLVLDTIPHAAYVVDISNHRVLHANSKIHVASDHKDATTCHARFYGLAHRCADCPIAKYEDSHSNRQFKQDFFDTFENRVCELHTLILDDESNQHGCLIIVTPKTAPSERELALESLLHTDETTGILNNRAYEEKGPIVFDKAARFGRSLAVMALKVDGLHHINSVQGYAQGDIVLRDIAMSMEEALPREALFARLRGNDFSILYPLSDPDAESELRFVLDKLRRTVVNACPASAKTWLLFRVGVSRYPRDGSTFEALNRKARQAIAMCGDTRKPFACAQYDDKLVANMREREELMQDLEAGLRRNEMRLLFQPKYDLRSSRIVGAEALIRWHHPTRGWLAPDTFIPLAEENMAIHTIDNWVINEACRLWEIILNRSQIRLPLSVNMSPQKFFQPDMLSRLVDATRTYNLATRELELELTERTALQDISKAMEVMESVRKKGFRLSIDDFGTGYSSLNYLRALPFDAVKLDRSFVVDSSARARAVLHAIVALLKVYKAQIIFEGIETEEQFLFARQAGCDLVQGYYTGRPMKSEELILLLIGQQQAPQYMPKPLVCSVTMKM